MKPVTAAVVFDLDGTLVDSMPLVLRAYAHALEPYRSPVSEEEIRLRLGGPPQRIFEQLLTDSTHVTGALRRLEDYGAENWKLIQAFPGMGELLQELRAGGVTLAVWTGRERESAQWLLRQHGVADLFAICVCGDDLASHKPDPAGLREVLRQLGLRRDEAIFVGDSAVDVLAGAAIDVRTLLITHGLALGREVTGKAWRIAGTPAEAYALLRNALKAGKIGPGRPVAS